MINVRKELSKCDRIDLTNNRLPTRKHHQNIMHILLNNFELSYVVTAWVFKFVFTIKTSETSTRYVPYTVLSLMGRQLRRSAKTWNKFWDSQLVKLEELDIFRFKEIELISPRASSQKLVTALTVVHINTSRWRFMTATRMFACTHSRRNANGMRAYALWVVVRQYCKCFAKRNGAVNKGKHPHPNTEQAVLVGHIVLLYVYIVFEERMRKEYFIYIYTFT